MIYYASYGHRYNDPMSTIMGRDRDEVEKAVQEACEEETKELKAYCDQDHNEDDNKEEDCSLCNPELVTYGIWPLLASDVSEIGRQKILDGFREIRGTEAKTFHLSQD